MAAIYLRSVSGAKQLELKGQMIAGRSEESDLVLSEGHPSRRHAQIKVDDQGIWVEDLGSTNGTFVNDRRLEAPAKLEPGDRVRFDSEEFEVVDPDAGSEPAADPNATVFRTPDQEAAAKAEVEPKRQPAVQDDTEPKQAPAARRPPPAAPAEPSVREVEGAGEARRPGAWADPNQVKEGGTVLYDNAQLQELLAEARPSPEPIADADAPYLIVTAGALNGSTIKLKAPQQTNVWDVGRDAERDIRFDEDGVSGFHAKIVNEGSRWKVIDQMSANGTLVNQKRGTISFLSPGDRIRFGPVECVFQLPTGASAKAAASDRTAGSSRSTLVWIAIVAALAVVAAAAYLAI